MKVNRCFALIGVVLVGALAVAGCGSASSSTGITANEPISGEPKANVPSEAESPATGDIPDNQAFLTFKDPAAGYVIRYPEGWARKGVGNDVIFREKANLIHIAVRKGPAPKSDGAKTTFTRSSAPDPVTGKSITLMVDRYEYGHAGKVAVLELSTPEGVDNVDAYRMINESFRWHP